jgi:hypothetical protein
MGFKHNSVLIIIEIVDEVCARAQNWSAVEYPMACTIHKTFKNTKEGERFFKK